jgi:TetR/AcrR family transcriptional regulator, transcriptional repressor for nem operon
MNKSERTRRFIIEKTAPVFNMRGYEGTSLSILQDVTGLTKGSLYGNFSDKEEIAREAFLYSMAKVREFVGAKLALQKSAKEKLTALLNFYADYVFNPPIQGGCPLLNNAVQVDDHHAFLRKTVSDEIGRTISFIAFLLNEGKKKGEFRKDIRSMDLANLFFASIEGAIMVSRVSQSDAAMKAVIKHCKNILDSISIK